SKVSSSKVDYLHAQAVAKEEQQHKKELDNARAAMEQYEQSVRKNFVARNIDMILDSGYMESDAVRAEVAKLTCSDSKYMRPLFGGEWSNGRRKVSVRCEPCYEAYLASKKKDVPALAIFLRRRGYFSLPDVNVRVFLPVKMYLPPFQFPTLCDAAAASGMKIGKKH
ncbi:hypothetical protein Y032_0211g2164, partial [Ancylostoma ceylanicum]